MAKKSTPIDVEKPEVVEFDNSGVIAVILDMSRTLEDCSKELKSVAKKLDERGDITYASQAMSAVTNCLMNLRLDLIPTRIIREYDKILFTKFFAQREEKSD